MAASKTIGGINVNITATTASFAKNIASAQKMTKSFTKTIGGLAFNLKTLGAALAVGGMTKLVANQYEAIGTMKDLADKTGINVEKIAGLELVAREAGVSMSTLEKGLVKLNTEMGMQGDKALRSWIEKTAKLTTAQERLAAATSMFGSRGSDMVRLVAGGVEAFDEAQAAAERSGMAVSAATALGVDKALESYERLKDNTVGIFRTIAAESWPYLQALVDGTNSLIDNAGGGKTIGTFITDVMVHMSKSVVDLMQQMVGGVLSLVADLHGVVMNSRLSGAGKLFGMGYNSSADAQAASDAWANAITVRDQFKSGPRWSDGIDKYVSDAREAAAKAVLNTGPGFFESLGGSLKKYGQMNLDNLIQGGAGVGNMLWGKLQVGMLRAGSMDISKAAASRVAQRPALSFAESGSVESYRQQAAIRRQNEDVGKRQLKTQEKMLSELQGIRKNAPVLVAANFGR